MNDKLLYRIPEVAEHLSISRSKVYELLKSGELRSVHIDRTRLVRARDLQGLCCLAGSRFMTVGTIERQGRRPMPTTSSMAGVRFFRKC